MELPNADESNTGVHAQPSGVRASSSGRQPLFREPIYHFGLKFDLA